MSTGFRMLDNLRSNRVSTMAYPPWDTWTKYPIPEEISDKKTYRAFCAASSVKHCFYSAVEGVDANTRVGRDNQPFMVHAMVVDYDFADALSKMNITKDGSLPSELRPAYGCTTFSGNARVVWKFEVPVRVANKKHADRFLKKLAAKIKCGDWFPGYEEESATNSAHYYEIGYKWIDLYPEAVISKETLWLCVYEASVGMALEDGPQVQFKVPIEAVAEEVEKVFPGRWQGKFGLGARGVRFWDPDADNETASVVTEAGMVCFTGDEAFVPWYRIFGMEFVRQFEGNRLAEIQTTSFYDGTAFWLAQRNGSRYSHYERMAKDDYTQHLRVAGFNGARSRGQASEIDRVENVIKRTNRIEGAYPFIHFPEGIMTYQNKRYLNVTEAIPIEPAPPGFIETFTDGREHFPFLYGYFVRFFEPLEGEEDQLEYFFAWLKHFYVNAYNRSPRPGHAIFIAGPAGKGKTLMVRGVIGKLVGGYADASAYLVDGSQWTDDLVGSPIIAVEDSQASLDESKRLRYAALLKKITANFSLPYNGKYKSQNNSLPWYGRAVVTCNVDPASLRILPSLEISNRDKVSLFKTSKHDIALPSTEELEEILNRELPFFARFLMDWEVPKNLIAKDPRFGVKPFHHPELAWESEGSGSGSIIFELLVEFLDAYFTTEPSKEAYTGTAAALYREIVGTNTLMQRFSVQQLGIALAGLVAQGWNIQKPTHKDAQTGMRKWTIPKDLKMIKEAEDE